MLEPPSEASGDLLRRSVDERGGVHLHLHLAGLGGDVGGDVLGRQLAQREAVPDRAHVGDAVDAEGAPVGAFEVEGDEVPAPAEVDEPVRLDPPLAARPGVVGVAKAQDLPVAGRCRHQGEHRTVHLRAATPAGQPHRVTLQGVHPAAEALGQHLLQLGECAQRRLLQPFDRSPAGGAQADGDRHGLVVVEQQRRHRGAGREAVPTDRATSGQHRIAQPA